MYQGQLPLQLMASLDLGCVAAVTPAARDRQIGDGFALSELQVGLQRDSSVLLHTSPGEFAGYGDWCSIRFVEKVVQRGQVVLVNMMGLCSLCLTQ